MSGIPRQLWLAEKWWFKIIFLRMNSLSYCKAIIISLWLVNENKRGPMIYEVFWNFWQTSPHSEIIKLMLWPKSQSLLYCITIHLNGFHLAKSQVSHLISGALQHLGESAERMLLIWWNRHFSQSWKQLKFKRCNVNK